MSEKKSIIEVVSGNELEEFDIVFRRWFSIIDEYSEINNFDGDQKAKVDDVPFYYNERATLSSFVGALWRSGYNCLEEFATEKEFKEGDEKTMKAGRGDLYFTTSSREAKNEFIIEAKICFSAPDTIKDSAEKSLEDANKDALAHIDRGVTKLSMAFVVPRKKSIFTQKELTKMIEGFGNLGGKKTSVVHYYPSSLREFQDEVKRFYPGISVFLSKVK